MATTSAFTTSAAAASASAAASITSASTAASATADEIAALQAALAAEHAAIYGYGVVGALLHGREQGDAMSDWRLHSEGRDTLTAMILKLGATPVAADPAYDLPFPVTDAASARRLAAYIEDGVTRAYLGVVAVTDPRLRAFGALAMQAPASRAATWRGCTTAFPGMSSPGATA
jgi:Domain of unknown function (DUF4439)